MFEQKCDRYGKYYCQNTSFFSNNKELKNDRLIFDKS